MNIMIFSSESNSDVIDDLDLYTYPSINNIHQISKKINLDINKTKKIYLLLKKKKFLI